MWPWASDPTSPSIKWGYNIGFHQINHLILKSYKELNILFRYLKIYSRWYQGTQEIKDLKTRCCHIRWHFGLSYRKHNWRHKNLPTQRYTIPNLIIWNFNTELISSRLEFFKFFGSKSVRIRNGVINLGNPLLLTSPVLGQLSPAMFWLRGHYTGRPSCFRGWLRRKGYPRKHTPLSRGAPLYSSFIGCPCIIQICKFRYKKIWK